MPALLHGSDERERVSDRAFRVLGAMRELGSGPHSLRSIISRSGLSRSTVQRLIHSAMKNGVIWQPRHGHYALTEHQTGKDLPHQLATTPAEARHLLGILHTHTGHTAALHATVLADVPVQMCVGRVQSPGATPAQPAIGQPRALEADAAGHAILAYLDLPHPRPQERHVIRRRGWAVSSDPARGARMLAAPILRFGIPVGSLSITGEATAIDSAVSTCAVALTRATARLK
ncbi:helix-turn-helix domain-containing protein [Streptomyces sp. NPDC054887]